MQKLDQRSPPYLPYKTFESAIQALEQGIPPRLDRSVYPSMSGAAQNAILSAFKFLGLTDAEGVPQPLLNRLVEEKQSRQEILNEVLRASFPDLVELGASNASVQQLRNAMAGYNVEGEMHRKAISFFLKAAESAGLKRSTYWTKITRQRNGATTRTKKPRTPVAVPATEVVTPVTIVTPRNVSDPPSGESRSFKLSGGDLLAVTVSRPFVTLPAQDRRLLFWLIDKLEEYENAGSLTDGRELQPVIATGNAAIVEETDPDALPFE